MSLTPSLSNMFDSENQHFKLAVDFINSTNQHLFLTGKAGTGKTTFLKYISQNSHKRVLVAAPTGVAAINAGGVTLHSLFQLPFEPFIPNSRIKDTYRFGKNKLNLLQQAELLIIDEVSMLRSDTLDAIEATLRFARRSKRPFGGIQMLYIGDLFQLPPVVKNDEWELLKHHYKSPFFFHAKSIESTNLIYLELKKIYRQQDQRFVDLLNRVRNNCLTGEDYELLNSKYNPTFTDTSSKRYITLCTHNYQADQINTEKLKKIKAPEFYFKGEVKGEFPDSILPTEEVLTLKVGAQVMFIKNDLENPRRYYNGKIAVITEIGEDGICVQPEGSDFDFVIEKEIWRNVKYRLNEENQEIEEEELGTFVQYPIRLAWAITIHKSQGLTFDYAIIDAKQAFAAGQSYVALSRCRSLDGIVLRSQIMPSCIQTNTDAIIFSSNDKPIEILNKTLEESKKIYWRDRLLQYFDWQPLLKTLRDFQYFTEDHLSDEIQSAHEMTELLYVAALKQQEIAVKFLDQLRVILQSNVSEEMRLQKLKERVTKAVVYFFTEAKEELLKPVQKSKKSFKGQRKAKKYWRKLNELETDIILFFSNLKRARYEDTLLLDAAVELVNLHDEEELFVDKGEKKTDLPEKKQKGEPRERKSKEKPIKGETQRISFDLFKAGKSIPEIADERNLKSSTIETHLSRFVISGELDISAIMSEERVNKLKKIICEMPEEDGGGLKFIKEVVGEEYTYGEIRLVVDYMKVNRCKNS